MSEVSDWPLGEYSEVQRSGAAAVFDAVGVVDGQVQHAAHLQAVVDEIRELAVFWCDGLPGQPFARRAGKRLLAILDRHAL